MAGTEVRQRNQLEYFMAQYEEFTIDQGSDVAIKIHCTDENGDQKVNFREFWNYWEAKCEQFVRTNLLQ